MSHTSEGVPGTRYAYNGDRFSLLDAVVARAAGKSFAAAVQERIIAPLGLKHIAPTPQSAAFAASGLERRRISRTWRRATHGTATVRADRVPDGLQHGGRAHRLGARLRRVLDGDGSRRIPQARDEGARLDAASASGETFPYGLGWFATDYKGVRVIWHYGYWTAWSTLVIKVPSQD